MSRWNGGRNIHLGERKFIRPLKKPALTGRWAGGSKLPADSAVPWNEGSYNDRPPTHLLEALRRLWTLLAGFLHPVTVVIICHDHNYTYFGCFFNKFMGIFSVFIPVDVAIFVFRGRPVSFWPCVLRIHDCGPNPANAGTDQISGRCPINQ